jgi:cellulose synthase/poly-beta-1,6-N-acetylglucosamine synthase-like glycosyltransferase
MLEVIFIASLVTLVIPPITYYVWMRSKAKNEWNLAVDKSYFPMVSLVIPTYNEASVIYEKMKDVQRIDYPEDKLQVILIDSASTDGTLRICKEFLKKQDLRFPVRLLAEEQRMGKSHALNKALEYAKGDIIATSDADSFWDNNALRNAVSFFADPSVGAVTGREELTNLEKTIHTLSEGVYRNFYYTLRLGESKVSSTIIFQGELSLYRKSVFDKFEDKGGRSDDTGTIVGIISHGYRCIFVPEAVFHDTAAYSFGGRLTLKSRRAQHLISGIIESLKLKIQRKFPLSSAIVLFNFYMHVISPLLLVTTIAAFGAMLAFYFQILWFVVPLTILLLIPKKSRLFIVSYLTSNLALILGLIQHFMGPREVAWRKIEEMRTQ